jgi:hypothetical protein
LANQAVLSLLLVNWVVAFAYFAPTALTNRKFLYQNPKIGLAIWATLFVSSIMAAALALGLACYSVFITWTNLQETRIGSDSWLEALVVSFAPWLVLAFAGIATALVNQKLEGVFSSAHKVSPALMGAKQVGEFEGFAVLELPLDFAYLGSRATDRTILQTRGARKKLTIGELQVCHRHEVAHLRMRHGRVVAAVALANQLLGSFAVTRAMSAEVSLLIELVADSAVEDKETLSRALHKLGSRDREAQIRIAVLAE